MFSYQIIIKNQNNDTLKKDLLIYSQRKKEYRINYDFLYDKKLGKDFYLNPNVTIPVSYKIEENDFIIYAEGNKLALNVNAFFEKFHENVSVEESDSFDPPWETGLPYFNKNYREYKDGKIINYDTTDKVVKEVEEIIKNKGNLYEYLSDLVSVYNDFADDNETIEFKNESCNDDLLLKIIPRIWNLYVCLSDEKKKDLEFNLKLMEECPGIYIYLNKSMQCNSDIIRVLINKGLVLGEGYRSRSRYEKVEEQLREQLINMYKREKSYFVSIINENPEAFYRLNNFIEFDKVDSNKIKGIFEKAAEENKVPKIVLKFFEND